MNKKIGIIAAITASLLGGLALTYGTLFDYNESGQRHFVQTFTGSTKVVYAAGPFWKGGGIAEPYNNVMTLDNKGPDGRCEYEQNDGFKVQYGDGGWGVVCGQIQFSLPDDEATMKAMHTRYRSESGVRTKLTDTTIRGIFTSTAELFTSTEAYSTKRSQIQQYVNDQILNGGYITATEEREVVVGFDEKNNTDITQTKNFSIITTAGDKYAENPLASWGMNTGVKFVVTGFDFEQKTIDQIGVRRDANNRAETAQEEAKAAYWETKKAEAEGEKDRVTAEYREKVLAETLIQKAERDKQLALIAAQQQKEQALLLTEAAVAATAQKKQEVLQAKQEAEKVILLADAESYRLKETQKAGELVLKLNALTTMNKDTAEAQALRKVPQTVIYSGQSADSIGTATDVTNVMNTQLLKNIQALGINTKIK